MPVVLKSVYILILRYCPRRFLVVESLSKQLLLLLRFVQVDVSTSILLSMPRKQSTNAILLTVFFAHVQNSMGDNRYCY